MRIVAMAQALIVVSVLALSACGGSPSVDALAAVNQACITTQGLHYDIDANMAAPGQRIGYTIQVAGANYHVIGSMSIEEDVSSAAALDSNFQLIVLDGIAYSQEDGGDWDVVDNFPLQAFINVNALCPQLSQGSIARSGEESIRSTSTTRYTRTASNVDGFDADETWEYWVTTSGELVRTRTVITLPDNLQTEFIVNISDIGEANVITAPTFPRKQSPS